MCGIAGFSYIKPNKKNSKRFFNIEKYLSHRGPENSGFFKNNAQLLNTLQSQKNIASNRNKYLRSEKEIIRKKIIENNLKKIKAEEKAKEYKRLYISELENKNYQ